MKNFFKNLMKAVNKAVDEDKQAPIVEDEFHDCPCCHPLLGEDPDVDLPTLHNEDDEII